ncbi:hypothetical protein ACMAVI_006026 [Burkholderia cenocepacia]
MEAWAEDVASGAQDTPRILLLVGGPGNGKTEAIEHTIRHLGECLGAEREVIDALSKSFHPPPGKAVDRVVSVDVGSLTPNSRPMFLSIVQDASATAGKEGGTAPQLLLRELDELLRESSGQYYLCCVNRGVLDDALIYALDHGYERVGTLLETITRSVSLSSTAPSCWPLDRFPEVAVWPMDVESLLVSPEGQLDPPASTLLAYATNPTYWPNAGECPAGEECPFCHSQRLLAREDNRTALLRILRWYELASGKRWSFRDLLSLISYLLAGRSPSERGKYRDSCQWAANLKQLAEDGEKIGNPKRQQLTAPFDLAISGYQHALFHRWNPDAVGALRQGLKDLGLGREISEVRVILGLQYFLHERKDSYLPATIESLLESQVELLDPAMASPDIEVAVSMRSKVKLGELDTRFSRSITGGIDFIRRYQVLAKYEINLLRKLEGADNLLSLPAVRRRNPTAASRVQRVLRDFACRFVRRSICTRSSVVADVEILESFQKIVEDDDKGQRLFEVAAQVKDLLNSGKDFEVSLATTFGQPLPPQQRQATLVVDVRKVRIPKLPMTGRPRSPICFLEVGHGQSTQTIALTYDLFKAVKELERGLSPAALPRTVVALLDATKARLSGPIVRDLDVLSDAKIRIGIDGTEIGMAWNGSFFSVHGGV